MLILHLYLARELLKTFIMTSITLTLLVVMGGGVANIFRGEAVGAEGMAKIFLFLTPVAVTLILPVAALFSAAITYGRAAADNEILACRAAGINIHKLLLSALLLGLFVTVFTYWSWNYLLPTLSRQIEEITRRDLPTIVKGQFQKAKPLSFGRYRMTARQCATLDRTVLAADAPAEHTYLQLSGVAFCETDAQEAVRFGTADITIVDFDRTEAIPRVTVDLQGVRSFDASRKQYYELAHQVLGPFQIPLPIRRKLKFETLGTLLAYRQKPDLDPEVADLLSNVRREMMAHCLYGDVVRQLDPDQGGDGTCHLASGNVGYAISAEQFAVDPEDGKPSLRDVRVIEKGGENGDHLLTADSATFELRSGLDRMHCIIMVELVGNVEIRHYPLRSDDRVVKKPKESLKPIAFDDQPQLVRQAASFDANSLWDPGVSFTLRPKQERARGKLLTWLAKFRSEIQGEINFRASYSLCSVAIILFGAVLGIIARGGQVLTAFGISCIPMLFVVVAGIVGRNLSDRPAYETLSITVMWAAAVFMYLATGFVAMKILKR
ncbi:MAG TPA: LptF/LptG family permease [Phycisphaerae bacterium]|nr:LptF/LptG family permease [Phycisphaerae bacterium]